MLNSIWINPVTGRRVQIHSLMRSDYGNMELPALISDVEMLAAGFFRLTEASAPLGFDPLTQTLSEEIAFVNGEYRQQWTVGQIDAETVAANQAMATISAREAAKAARQKAVGSIIVTTTSGKTFDGDETSQTRMTRAIVGLQAAGATTITWTLADNSVALVTLPELTEALILAGQNQAALWQL